MKSTKKVRAQAKPKVKTKKKVTGTVAKHGKSTKNRTEKKQSPKQTATSAKKVTKTPASPRVSTGKDKSPAKKSVVQRKGRELSKPEYDAFVKKTAESENVRPEELVTIDRRKPTAKPARKSSMESEAVEHKPAKTLRPKVQRRRQIDPTTCERDYSNEEIEFMNALDEYKRNSGRMFPTCSEILEVFRGLGYTKQSHEESIEINANPESGDVYVTSLETSVLSREGEQAVDSEQIDMNSNRNIPNLLDDKEDDTPSAYIAYPMNSTPFFL